MEMPVRNQTARNQPTRNQSRQRHQPRPPARRGFTLLELLIAIMVIGILAAFLLPAIQGVIGTAKDAAVRNEISQLESAIAMFKAKFGIDPPSHITFYEALSDWTYTAPTMSPTMDELAKQAEVNHSRSLLQRMWPNIDLSLDLRDWNPDDPNDTVNTPGTSEGIVRLDGDECLVFFLGGVPTTFDNPANPFGLLGFSKNPTTPLAVPATPTETRDGPFFEFVPSRLRTDPTAVGSLKLFGRYFDPLSGQTSPYLYLSSYDGRGYIATDIPAATNLPSPFVTAAGTPHKPKSFQIISPGADTLYSAAMGSVIYDTSAPSNNGLGTNREAFDNITNFSSGRLKP